MRYTLLLALLASLATSCYQTLDLEGFDKEKWGTMHDCNTYRVRIADLLIANQDVLLTATQNEIENLLGRATEHELYDRNQKFFHYRLTPDNACGDYEAIEYLSIRFNAMGRANLVQVMMREPQ